MRTLLFPLFLAILLAGCGNSNTKPMEDASMDCAATQIPAPTAGSEFLYSAEGRFDDFLHPTAAVDWRIAGSRDGNGPFILPAASRIRISIAEELRFIPDASGQPIGTYQVTYFAQRPQDTQQLAVLDEWIDLQGHVVRISYRNTLQDHGQVLNSLRFLDGQPAALLGSQFAWGADGNFTRTLTIPRAATTPKDGASHDLTIDNRPRLVDGSCGMQFQATWTSPTTGSLTQVTAAMLANESMPTTYEVTTSGEPTFRMTKLEDNLGEGDGLPAWKQTHARPGLLVDVPDYGFLSDTDGLFPTSWNDANRAARNEPTISAWHDANPEAEVALVLHVLGNDSSIIDQWAITWKAKSGTGLKASITTYPSILGIPNRSITSENRDVSTPFYPNAWTGALRTSLADAASLYRELVQDEPEVLLCFMETGTCGLGSHATTAYPRAGQQGGTLFINPGLTFDVATGKPYQVQAWGEAALGPPV